MNSRLFRWPSSRSVLWPALILALLNMPAFGADSATTGKPMPQRFMGIWQVTGVLSDASSQWVHTFARDDPRLMGGILLITPKRIIAKIEGYGASCDNPTVTEQKITAGQLIAHTMGGEHPTVRDFDLPFDPNEQLTVMWINELGGFSAYNYHDGTWMIEMPDGRLAMLWYNGAIVYWSRAPANIAPSASFDCNKANTPVEKTICGSMELSLCDSDISEGYESHASFLSGRAWRERDKRYLDALKQWTAEQKSWLKQRDTCGSDPKCLQNSMDARLDAMMAGGGDDYNYDAICEKQAPASGADAAPAAKPLPEKFLGIWQVSGVLTDAGFHWRNDFVNNDPRLMGGVALISPQKILIKAGGETVSCINPKMTAQNIKAGQLIKETMGERPSKVTPDGRHLEPPIDPTPSDYGLPFKPDAPLAITWVKNFDGYWRPLNANGTWFLEMPDGRLAMRWHYAAILLLSRAPATTKPADIKQTFASFDCAKARTPVEKSICGSLELSLLDSYVSEWYEGFINTLAEKLSRKDEPEADYYSDMMKRIKKEQRAWKKQRDVCGPDPQCLKDSMDERAKTLADGFAHYKI